MSKTDTNTFNPFDSVANPPLSSEQKIRKILEQYMQSDDRCAWFQMANTFLPFFGLSILAFYVLSIGGHPAWFVLLDTILGLLIVRMYVLQHDCGHFSLFATRKLNNIFGNLFSLFTLTPLCNWRIEHNLHHLSVCNIEENEEGYFWLMTTEQYANSSPLVRFVYRTYKRPVMQFGIGVWLFFIFIRRIPGDFRQPFHRKYRDTHWTNIGVFVFYPLLYFTFGGQAMLWIVLPSLLIGVTITVWGFYVQHFFPGAYWDNAPEWDAYTACLKGSSYFDLPKILLWFSADISVHHIHHINPRIPNYNLQKCMRENVELTPENSIGLLESFSFHKLHLWDQDKQSFVTIPAA